MALPLKKEFVSGFPISSQNVLKYKKRNTMRYKERIG